MEIVARAAALYLILWIVTRATGKATLCELSTFQLVFYIVLGDLIQQGVTLQDYSVTGAVLAIAVFTVMTVAVSWVNLRWPKARPLIHGGPVVVVSDGEMRGDLMKVERLSVDDLYEAARAEGIERMSQVRLAVLEADGQISFFKRDGDHEPRPRRRPEH
jgi:uncharacterized membrane protein YcaP (DUF421 family)